MEYYINFFARNIHLALGFLVIGGASISFSYPNYQYNTELLRLREEAKETLQEDIKEFNEYEDRPESDGPYNSSNNAALLLENVPFFKSSNEDFTEVYNYRWWMMSKHFRLWRDPTEDKDVWVVTEFFGWPRHASISGAIPCPAGHQFYDLRWFRDTKYLKSYIEYYMKGYASKNNKKQPFRSHIQRPESHHFTSWMVDGTEAFLKVHPDDEWRDDLLPHLENHQLFWDETFKIHKDGARTDELYKVLDVYDGMEFTISASLALIASDGPYEVYTEENWREYYLGWGAINRVMQSDLPKQYPDAFGRGYPAMYMARPTINSYYFANLRSLGNLYGLKAEQSGQQSDSIKSEVYHERARTLQEKTLSALWDEEDQFFYSFTAADNAHGVTDMLLRVRESVGYTPWYFNMIPEGETRYDNAWDMLSSRKGFYNENGMTTAETQHPLYNERAYAWNGRGWPFQNSVVNKAYANYLKYYKKDVTESDKELLYDLTDKLVAMHGEERNIGEWYIPSNGKQFGGVKDYFHSSFPDMLIEDLLGFTASHENEFSLHPLLPKDKWDYFYLGNLLYHGHDIDIIWKKDWDPNTEGDQSRLCVWVDNKLVSKSDSLNERLVVKLD